MKLPKNLLIKDTVSLFMGKYQYKVVLVSPASHWFRGKNLKLVEQKLSSDKEREHWLNPKGRTPNNKIFLQDLLETLKKFDVNEYDIRIETPLINVYTNNRMHIEALTSIDSESIKYVSLPSKTHPPLKKGDVIVKNLDFDYKVYMGNTRHNYKDFLNWSVNNDKIKVTKKCTKDLNKERSWGGSYFYVKGEKTLTMVKMFLGSDISRVETIIKA